jgi:intracellular septation protein A
MKLLWNSGKFLAYDMVASLFFFVLYAFTKSLPISVGVGIAVGVAQIGWDLARRRPIEAMQWLSLALVIVGGLSAIIAHDKRIMLAKPSLVYVIVGVTMLKRGWMNRYLPAEAPQWVPDLGERWGYAWAGLMFLSAVINLVAALRLPFLQWGEVMSVWALGSKLAMFAVQFTTMRWIGRRRALRAMAASSVEPTEAVAA